MKKLLLVLCAVLLLMTGCGGSKGVNKLVVGIDDEFAPMSFHNEQNELVGFEIDLAREACRRMGVILEFKPIDWNNKREEILSGNIDMIWNGLDITEERKEYMLFSKPYMNDRQIVLVRQDSNLDINSEYDLEGKVVGTQAGSVSDEYIIQNEELRTRLAEYKTYSKLYDSFKALNAGEIEVCICDEIIARYEINLHPNSFRIIDVRIGYITEMGIGFPKNRADLRDKVQETFDEMIKDGTAQEISETWFQADLINSQK